MVNQILFSVLAYYSTRIETAGNLSTWIGVRYAVCVRARGGSVLVIVWGSGFV
jgi:hypothetical protein